MRRELVQRSVVVVAAMVALVAGACATEPDAPRIQDAGFVRAAHELCERAIPPLRPDLKDKSRPTEEELAATVDDRATRLERIGEQLRALPVASDAQPAVSAWLGDWHAYAGVGHEYARALRTHDPELQTDIAKRALPPLRRISAFARANGLPACALDVVQLPRRSSPL